MTKKEVKENRRSKKIFLAILMVLFTGVLLTTSTYAWFTANKTVTVDQIDVNVAATNGLQLSVDGTTWKPAVTQEDILGATTKYAAAKNQIPAGNSSPVSTIGAINESNGFMNMFLGSIQESGGKNILTAEKSEETHGTGGDFVAFDLFFRTTSDTPIYLTNASNVIYSKGPNGLQNASRVAFVMSGNTAAGSDLATIQGMKASADSEVIIWEPNSDVHTATGVNNAINEYGKPATEGPDATYLDYVGVKAPIGAELNMPVNSTDGGYFQAVTPQIITKAAGIGTTFEKAFDLKAGITKVRVYMWIEGQDVDCENDASGGSISYNLQFSMNATAA